MNQIQSKREFIIASARKPSYYLDEAKCFIKKRNLHNALIVLEDGLSTFPLHANMWMERGKVLSNTHRKHDKEALRSFERAYELNPGSNTIATQLAHFLTKQGRYNPALYDRAERIFAEVYHREDKAIIILTALGSHYYMRNMKDMAVACFHKAMNQPGGDFYAQRRFEEMARFGTVLTPAAAAALETRLESLKPAGEMVAVATQRYG